MPERPLHHSDIVSHFTGILGHEDMKREFRNIQSRSNSAGGQIQFEHGGFDFHVRILPNADGISHDMEVVLLHGRGNQEEHKFAGARLIKDQDPEIFDHSGDIRWHPNLPYEKVAAVNALRILNKVLVPAWRNIRS